LLDNPLLSQRDLAKKAWVSVANVNWKLNILKQEGWKNKLIIEICEKDVENVTLWQSEINKRLKNTPHLLKVNDIVQKMAEGTKRYTLFKGDITDPDWWLKQNLTNDQIKLLADRLKLDENE
jgi:hypothetical protein